MLHLDISRIHSLGAAFASALRNRSQPDFALWLVQAEQSKFRPLLSFINGIRRDFEAVQAAFQLPWSNGLLEGHVNRLKFIKRQMFGRARFDLLRLRVLLFDTRSTKY